MTLGVSSSWPNAGRVAPDRTSAERDASQPPVRTELNGASQGDQAQKSGEAEQP
ncbi:hypothetical protein H4W33_004283 [Kibdelosporangium phytohabitans]|nr:hypothetical protein [Kibdelosporangium phytohabitans]